jgi:curli biogenesis system outer membrane secretion channel CsgG
LRKPPATALCALLSAAWPSHAAQAEEATKVETCAKKFGTLAVADPRSGLGVLQQYGLGSPSALLRMMVQQSGCFDVVERGVAMQNLQQERALMQQGELRADSNIGQGQMQVADFVMTPDVQIPTSTTGGLGGALSGLGKLAGIGGVLGGVAGGLKFKEASTSLLIADVRSGIQVAGEQGKASKTDFSLGGFSIGAVGGGLGGYTSSPEGKVVAASLLDNYNQIVVAIRDKATLIQTTTPEAAANAQASTRAEAPQPAGQLLAAKIANVKVYAEPSRESAVVATLQRTEELVASGEVKNGFVRIDAANFSGWVQRTMVAAVPGQAPPAGPAVMHASAAAPLATATPTYRYGHFVGTLDGGDKGQFRVLIDDEGNATGDGQLARIGAFGLHGKYEADKGQLALIGGSAAGQLMFIGRFDPARGVIVGSWSTGGLGGIVGTPGSSGGSFAAQRRP